MRTGTPHPYGRARGARPWSVSTRYISGGRRAVPSGRRDDRLGPGGRPLGRLSRVSTDEAADAQPRRPRKRRPLWKRLLLWAGLLLTGLVGLGVAAFLVAYLAIDVPDPNADFQTETSY